MARPKSEDKKRALMDAATKVIVTQGLSAPTATIAQEAGVSNGSLFTYFETKADLYNALYLDIKTEMATAALAGLPEQAPIRDQFFHVWTNWTHWALANPNKRKALNQLNACDDVSQASREHGHKAMATLGIIVEKSRANGPMKDAPFKLVLTLMNAVADATMDYMVQDPDNADKHCKMALDAIWRAIA